MTILFKIKIIINSFNNTLNLTAHNSVLIAGLSYKYDTPNVKEHVTL